MSEQGHSPDIEKWVKLIRADGVGPKAFARLLKQFGGFDGVFGASVAELTKVKGIGVQTAERIRRSLGKFNVDKELELADKLGVTLIHAGDKRYPAALRVIYDPPPVLYVKGFLERGDGLAVAIVGSRRCSGYGEEQASRFAHVLASAGFTVVSGGARGVDTSAHRGALMGGGRTISVQGCGLFFDFPLENAPLFQKIARNGACISELPLEIEAFSENFPARNRIIAGLCMAVLVIEASERSGALLTAQAALEYGREVMAVPGKIDSPLSAGSHQLIKQGARLVDCVEDVMDALGHIGEGLKEHVAAVEGEAEMPLFDAARMNLSEGERAVLESLDGEARHVEEIIAATGLGAGVVNSGLVGLRLKGLVKQLPGSLFVRVGKQASR